METTIGYVRWASLDVGTLDMDRGPNMPTIVRDDWNLRDHLVTPTACPQLDMHERFMGYLIEMEPTQFCSPHSLDREPMG